MPPLTSAAPVGATDFIEPRQLNIHIHPLVLLVPVAALVLHFAFPGFTRSASVARPAVGPMEPVLGRETLANLGPPLADAPGELGQKPGASGDSVRGQRDVLRERAQREEEQARQFAAERERVVVTVYYTEWCPSCRTARAYLQQRGIRFEEHDIERDSRARSRQRLLNPKGSIPTLLIEDQVLVGFSASRIEKALDRAARARLERSP